MKLKLSVYVALASFILISLGWWGSDTYKNSRLKDFQLPEWNKPKPLERYTIENLSRAYIPSTKINIQDNLFDFKFDPTLSGKEEKRVTGLVNIPQGEGPFPLVLLIRGYVDQEIYTTGTGTKRVGEYLSDNGFITIAPDFLGYGGSDKEADNIFEARFQTYTTTLVLLKSITKENFPKWDGKNIFIWGHSNGGQVALTTLEISQADYPTVLWAPVTESFPYSVLYYTNESDDQGKFIRKELAKFEKDYDTDKYSLTNYFDRINTSVEYHWGTNDDAISVEWKDKFIKRMKSLDVYKTGEKTFTNYNHSSADHNMNPLWSDVMEKTYYFFQENRN